MSSSSGPSRGRHLVAKLLGHALYAKSDFLLVPELLYPRLQVLIKDTFFLPGAYCYSLQYQNVFMLHLWKRAQKMIHAIDVTWSVSMDSNTPATSAEKTFLHQSALNITNVEPMEYFFKCKTQTWTF